MVRSAVENTAMAAFMATSVAAGLLVRTLELGTTRPTQASSYAYIGIGLTSLCLSVLRLHPSNVIPAVSMDRSGR